MIPVTRLNGTRLYINTLLIEVIEEVPDTLITLTTGKKIIVLEKASDVVSLVQIFLREIGTIRATVKSQDMEGS